MKKVLIIEDDADFADDLKARLSDSFEVEVCPDGQSGYYAIYEYKPDLVLLDLTIEQMDAVSLIGKMRVQKQFQKLPIIVLADSTTTLKADDALIAGGTEAVLKDEAEAISAVAASAHKLLTSSLARKAVAARAEPVPIMQPVNVATAAPAFALASGSENHAVPTDGGRYSTVTIPAPMSRFQNGHGTLPPFTTLAPPELEKQLEYMEPIPVSRASGFLDEYGANAHAVRQDFIRFRTAAPSERAPHLQSLLERLSHLNAEATASGLSGLGRYLTVLETRSKQLLDTIGSPTPPTLQGLAGAVDVLAALTNHLAELEPLNHLNPLAMVVDDENVSRRALCLGLEKAKIKTSGVDNPDTALLEAESKPFDLIYLDVDLPKMNGFALCARIRIIPSHRRTPIIFVTSLSDVKSRASSRVSGGNDFLTKPVNLSEVGITAWTLLISKRVLDNGPRSRT